MKILIALLCLGLLSACVHHETLPSASLLVSIHPAAVDVEGIWSLQGSSSLHGPYTGELALLRANDGTYRAVRTINYLHFYFEGLRVQEVWSGQALPNQDGLVITYELLDDQSSESVHSKKIGKHKAEIEVATTTVNEFFRLNAKNSLESMFSDKTAASYQECLSVKISGISSENRSIASAEQRTFTNPHFNLIAQTKSGSLIDRQTPTASGLCIKLENPLTMSIRITRAA